MVTILSVGLHVADADGAGALHLAVDVHGAGAALRDAAAVFRAGEADLLADDPQERGICFHLDVADSSIDVELCHELPLAGCPGGEGVVLLCRPARGRADWREMKVPARPLAKHSANGAVLPTAVAGRRERDATMSPQAPPSRCGGSPPPLHRKLRKSIRLMNERPVPGPEQTARRAGNHPAGRGRRTPPPGWLAHAVRGPRHTTHLRRAGRPVRLSPWRRSLPR